MHIDERYIHNVYEDRGYDRYIVDRDRHVAFSGGPGGIRHEPLPEERLAERDRHVPPSSFQLQHEMAARGDRGSYFRNNGGHPATLAVQRPMDMHNAPQPAGRPGMTNSQPRPMSQPQQQPSSRPAPAYAQPSRPTPQSHPYQTPQRQAPQQAAPRQQASKPAAQKPAPKPEKEEHERK
jgi:hypothetical protein